MRLTIAIKSVAIMVALITSTLVVVGVYLERRERDAVIEEAVNRLDAQASLLAAEIPAGAGRTDAWAGQAGSKTKARVTLIAATGRVLADSEEPAAQLENHRDRPEVAAALLTGRGQATRFSQSVHRDLFYYAQRVSSPEGALVLRLSIPLASVSRGFSRFRRDFVEIALLSFGLASLLATVWARGIARRLQAMVTFVRAVSRREPAPSLRADARDELGDLASALNAMATDLQGVLRRLEDEGQRSRTILTSLGEALLVLDGRERVTLVNPSAEKLFGLPALPQIGRTLLEVVRNHELDDLLKAAYRDDRGLARAEVTLIHPHRRTLSGTAAVIRDPYGGVQGTVLAFRDITELKRLEEMRMEFVLNVSHELRTPLTAIRGYAETLLEGGADTATARKFLEVIHRHSERLGRLLDDLLDLSNIELERTPLDLRPVAVPDVVRQALAVLEVKAEHKAVSLSAAVQDDLSPVLADRDRMVQILVNLIDNAVKYTPEGGKVSVTAQSVAWTFDTAGGPSPAATPVSEPAIEIAVSDTGIGIPPKDLPRLTERFYRVDKARSRELGGTGLGLAIVKHLVASHRGHLSIDSTLGEGTRVRVVLRAAPTAHIR